MVKYLEFNTEEEANNLISHIDECMGFPKGRTQTWAYPACFQNDYSPNETEVRYYVVVKEEIKDCLTQEQWDSQVFFPEDWVVCGTPSDIIDLTSGSTENYVGS